MTHHKCNLVREKVGLQKLCVCSDSNNDKNRNENDSNEEDTSTCVKKFALQSLCEHTHENNTSQLVLRSLRYNHCVNTHMKIIHLNLC